MATTIENLRYGKKGVQKIGQGSPFRQIGNRVYEETYTPGLGFQLQDTQIGGYESTFEQAANELLKAQTAQSKAVQKYPEAALTGQKQTYEMGLADKLVKDKLALNALATLGMEKELGLGQFAPPGGGMETVIPKSPGEAGFIGPPSPIKRHPSRRDASALAAILQEVGRPAATPEAGILDTLFREGEPDNVSYTQQEKGRKKSFLDKFYSLPMAFSE